MNNLIFLFLIDFRIFKVYLRKNSFTTCAYLWNISRKNDVRMSRIHPMNIHLGLFSTYLGEPIPYDPNVTPEVLAQRVNNLIY